jgi:hypothetical protein
MTRPSTVLSGTLLAAPTKGETKHGHAFSSVRLREDNKTAREWAVYAYSDHIRVEFAKLRRGEYVAFVGTFDARAVTDEGQTRIAWRLACTHIFTFGADGEESAA